jgi:hypothetical protein
LSHTQTKKKVSILHQVENEVKYGVSKQKALGVGADAKLNHTLIRINQLPVSAVSWQHGSRICLAAFI